jgi:hypothetical protein
MVGPCLCGDPYCWSCGDPAGARLEDSLETIAEIFIDEGYSENEVDNFITAGKQEVEKIRKAKHV